MNRKTGSNTIGLLLLLMSQLVCLLVIEGGIIGKSYAAPAGTSRVASLAGNWHGYNPMVPRDGACKIVQNGDKLTLTSEINTTGEGYLLDDTTIMSSWNGTKVKGRLVDNGKRINWENGTYWVRGQLSLDGNWYGYNPMVPREGACKIVQNGDKLTLTSEIGTTGEGYLLDDTTIMSSWNGTKVKGRLVENGKRINWENGTYWVRK